MNTSASDPQLTTTSISPQPDHPAWMKRVGWAIRGLMILFLVFDSLGKIMLEQHVVAATKAIGYPVDCIRNLGVICLVCTILYAIPHTSILGAILLTAYFGGAIASKARIGDPLFSSVLFGVYFGVLVWGGLYMQNDRLRRLVPLTQH